MSRSPTVLIDADGFAFKAASAAQKGIAWDEDTYTLHADMGTAKDIFVSEIETIRKVVGSEAKVLLAYSCPTRRYFRHQLLPTYKGNRKGTPSPLCYKDLKVWSEGEYETKIKPNLEADDVVGILATHPKLVTGEKIVCSPDKDLMQIPGLHLDPNDLKCGVYRVSEAFAQKRLWMQVLMGDSTDNYPGCPGIGAVTAERILESVSVEKYQQAVLKAYEKAKLTAADMLVQFNVARILQAFHYDFKKKEPILWQM